MKIQTQSQLGDELDQELAWRKRELITFKFMVGKGRDHQSEALRRAGIALMYAHWEGFVKHAGTAYVQFVARQRLTHHEMSANFFALAIKAKLHVVAGTAKASLFNEATEYFVEKLNSRAKLLWDGSIQTKSNLSAERFQEIMITLGLDYVPFQTKEKPVIEKLRESRNTIAHGRYLDVDSTEYSRLHGEVIGMLDEFRRQIENAAQLGRFRRKEKTTTAPHHA